MPTRVVKVPAAIELKAPMTDVPEVVPFVTFVRTVLLEQPRWVESYKALRKAKAVDDALDKLPAVITGTHGMPLAEEDWELLKKSCEEPGQRFPYPGWAMRQLMPYLDAIMSAEVDEKRTAAEEN